jgi:hypothetical protein
VSATPWAAVRLAIRSWVVTGSALSGDHVIWVGQQHRVPDGAYITLRLSTIDPLGHDESSITEAAGVLTEHLTGHRDAKLTITCFSGIDEHDATRAVLTLDSVRTAARLMTVANVLQAANVGVNHIADVRAIGATINNTQFDSRAELVVHLNLVSELTGAADAIQTVGPITSTIS